MQTIRKYFDTLIRFTSDLTHRLFDRTLIAAERLDRTPASIALVSAGAVWLAFLLQIILFPPRENPQGVGINLAPPDPLVLMGRRVYIENGCFYCHTLRTRPLAWEIRRSYGRTNPGYFPALRENEILYASPAIRGQRRIGPDLSRITAKYDALQLRSILTSHGFRSSLRAFHHYDHLFQVSRRYTDGDALSLAWQMRFAINAGLFFSSADLTTTWERLPGRTPGEALIAFLMARGKKALEYNRHNYTGN